MCPRQASGDPNQVISNTGFESPCSTKGESCRFSPLEIPIGFVPASRGGVYIESNQAFKDTLSF